jgi:Ca2+-binding EF-hand superfamily protein
MVLSKETLMRSLSAALVLAVMLSAGAAHGADQTPPYDVKAVFAEADANGNGEIDLCEFHTRLVEVFYNTDADKNGFLTPNEYEKLPFSGKFADADVDGNQRLTLHEFIAVRYRQFVEADTNRDGALSFEEVRAAYEGKERPQ